MSEPALRLADAVPFIHRGDRRFELFVSPDVIEGFGCLLPDANTPTEQNRIDSDEPPIVQ
jgi:hypothetical protein